jgi:hypothetical protein
VFKLIEASANKLNGYLPRRVIASIARRVVSKPNCSSTAEFYQQARTLHLRRGTTFCGAAELRSGSSSFDSYFLLLHASQTFASTVGLGFLIRGVLPQYQHQQWW